MEEASTEDSKAAEGFLPGFVSLSTLSWLEKDSGKRIERVFPALEQEELGQ